MRSSGERREAIRREALAHLEVLYGLARRLTGGDAARAEELVRETVREAYRAGPAGRAGASGRAWLAAILRDVFLEELARTEIRSEDADRVAYGPAEENGADARRIALDPAGADPEAAFLDRLDDRDVTDAIERLEDGLRIPLVLAELEGLGYREIAEGLDVPVGSVAGRLRRARRRLRERLRRRVHGGPAAPDRDGGDAASPPEEAGSGGGTTDRGGCREARAKVYEYLDGELDPETQERMHRHVETCQRCYRLFDSERLLLDAVGDRGLAADARDLRRRLRDLLGDGGDGHEGGSG